MEKAKSTIKKSSLPFKYYHRNDFDGRYMKLAEVRDLIIPFKEYYYEKKLENPSLAAREIINNFNDTLEVDVFFPYTEQYRRWRKLWDDEIMSRLEGAEVHLESKEVKAVKTRDSENNLLVPTDQELDSGSKNLAGELMNDAMTMLKNDQRNEDLYEDEVIVKRRNYILNVFNFVTRAVNAKESLRIKKSQDKRETAGFLMDLVRRSTVGGISENDISILKDSIIQKQDEHQTVGNSD